MLTKESLFKMALEEVEPEPVEQTTPGKRTLNTVKSVGSKAVQGAALIGAGVASVAKPVQPNQVNTRY